MAVVVPNPSSMQRSSGDTLAPGFYWSGVAPEQEEQRDAWLEAQDEQFARCQVLLRSTDPVNQTRWVYFEVLQPMPWPLEDLPAPYVDPKPEKSPGLSFGNLTKTLDGLGSAALLLLLVYLASGKKR